MRVDQLICRCSRSGSNTADRPQRRCTPTHNRRNQEARRDAPIGESPARALVATPVILQAARTPGPRSSLPRAPTPEAMLAPRKLEVLLSWLYEDLEAHSCDVSEVDHVLKQLGESCPRSRQARHDGSNWNLGN